MDISKFIARGPRSASVVKILHHYTFHAAAALPRVSRTCTSHVKVTPELERPDLATNDTARSAVRIHGTHAPAWKCNHRQVRLRLEYPTIALSNLVGQRMTGHYNLVMPAKGSTMLRCMVNLYCHSLKYIGSEMKSLRSTLSAISAISGFVRSYAVTFGFMWRRISQRAAALGSGQLACHGAVAKKNIHPDKPEQLSFSSWV